MNKQVGEGLRERVLCLFLSFAFALGFMGLIARPALAVPKVGNEWYVGDEIDIVGYWFVDDDQSLDGKLIYHCSGTAVLPEAEDYYLSGFGQWYFDNVLPRDSYISSSGQVTESSKEDLNVIGTSDKKPYGVRIKSGNGSQDNPFVFQGIYTKDPKAKDLTYNGEDQELVTAGHAP